MRWGLFSRTLTSSGRKIRSRTDTSVRKSAPHTQAQNGVVESTIGSVKDRSRILMEASKAPRRVKDHAWHYALDIRNSCPTHHQPTISPMEALDGVKPDFTNYIPFYRRCYSHVPTTAGVDSGWDSKGEEVRHLRQAPETKDSSLVLKQNGQVVVRHKIISHQSGDMDAIDKDNEHQLKVILQVDYANYVE